MSNFAKHLAFLDFPIRSRGNLTLPVALEQAPSVSLSFDFRDFRDAPLVLFSTNLYQILYIISATLSRFWDLEAMT